MFGQDYASAHPELVIAVMISASMEWAAMTIAAGFVAEDETVLAPGVKTLRHHDKPPVLC